MHPGDTTHSFTGLYAKLEEILSNTLESTFSFADAFREVVAS